MLKNQRVSTANLNMIVPTTVLIVIFGCAFGVRAFRYYQRIRCILTAAAEKMIGAGSVES